MRSSKAKETGTILVLDTSAFVAGFDPLTSEGEQYTVPLVEQEISRNSMSCVRINAAKESGRLKIVTPSPDFLESVKRAASLIGDKFVLSDTDLQVLSLASELHTGGNKVMILTDDYSMQNVANEMGVEFSALATFGIKYRLEWMRYCPACRKRYPSNYGAKTCEVCGTLLKRKSIKRNDLSRVSEVNTQQGRTDV